MHTAVCMPCANYMCRNEGKSISSIKALGNIHTSKAVDLRILVLLPFTYLDSKKSSCVVSMDLFKTPPPPFHFKNLTLKVAVSHSSLIGKRFPLDSSRESSRGHGAVAEVESCMIVGMIEALNPCSSREDSSEDLPRWVVKRLKDLSGIFHPDLLGGNDIKFIQIWRAF